MAVHDGVDVRPRLVDLAMNETLAIEKQQRIAEPVRKILGDYGIPGIKYAMELNGYYGGPARLPLLALLAEQKLEIERMMADIRN